MNKIAKAINASQTIFAHCLALPFSSKLIIFADDTTRAVAELLGETAVQMELWPLTVYCTFATDFGWLPARSAVISPIYLELMGSET